jgi:hypothetical protein
MHAVGLHEVSEMQMPDLVTGACLCGAVRLEAVGPPRRVTHCHCEMCRRATGAVAGTFATWETSAVRFFGTLARYDSSAVGWRGFCSNCGSSICFGYKPRPERIYVAVGALDTPDAFPAGFHDHRESRIAWLHLDDDLPDAADFKPPAP